MTLKFQVQFVDQTGRQRQTLIWGDDLARVKSIFDSTFPNCFLMGGQELDANSTDPEGFQEL